MKPFVITLLLLAAGLQLHGQCRSHEELKDMARTFLMQKAASKSFVTSDNPKPDALKVVEEKENIAIVSGEDGMVVLPRSSSSDRILAYATQSYSPESMPAGFVWWLNAVDSQSAVIIPQSVPTALKSEVAPMIKSQWGQDAPFNQQCPQLNGTQCLTGCVATAMAQICRYFGYPKRGYNRNIYTWYNGNEEIDADFSTTTFDYANMLDSYSSGYSDNQSAAVASLMEVCGKAAEMQYGTDGSYTNCGKMQSAMALYLNYPFLMYLKRELIEDDVWMYTVYSNISRGLPVYYSGGGHGFVLDGYDSEGRVHVNWGWSGAFDGYYDLGALSPGGRSYNSGEEMCCEIRPADYKPQIYEVSVSQAGELESVIDSDQVLFTDRLKVNGNINGTDFNCLKRLVRAGRLIDLDLSNANVVAGGEPLILYNASGTVNTEDNVFPNYAFSYCYHLGAVKLPNSIVSIGWNAFFLNEYLMDLTIPAKVTSLDGSAFGYMPQLCRLSVDKDNPVFDSRNDCNAIIRTATNELVRGCQSTKIPKEVTSLGNCAFYSCYWLKQIDLPAGLKHIGDFAFSTCTRLRGINLPEGLETIGTQAFYWCGENLIKQFKLPSTLKSIGDYAFITNSIETFVLPAGVTYVGGGIVGNCGLLKTIRVDKRNPVYDSRNNCNAIIRTANNELVTGIMTTTIPRSVKRIGQMAFQNTLNMETIVIPEGVDSIKYRALAYCDHLKSLSLPSSLRYIGYEAFSGNSKLTSITIPKNVDCIDARAFYGCTNLEKIVMLREEPVENHDEYYSNIFYGCDYSTPLYVPYGSKKKYMAAEGWKNFTNIIEMEAIEPVVTETSVTYDSIFRQPLADKVIDNIYYNVGSDSYDSADECIVIGKHTDMAQITDATPGSDEVKANFTGVILEAAEGNGTIKINAQTIGSAQLAVQAGNQPPRKVTLNTQGEAVVNYDVSDDTFIYIYAVASSLVGNEVRIYSITVMPDMFTGLDNMQNHGFEDSPSSVVNGQSTYDLQGRRVSAGQPYPKGIYIQGRKVVAK